MHMENTIEKAVKRICRMERIYDILSVSLLEAPEKLVSDPYTKDMLDTLIQYYESGEWLKDFKLDEQGLIPKDIKRGVLSEDGVYNLIMEYPIHKRHTRKPNRLTSYDYSQNGAYFITICTHGRAKLFEAELPVGNGPCAVPQQSYELNMAANQIIHKWIMETEEKFSNISVDKYVIMPDHLHMIVMIKERHEGRSLQDIMHYFKTMTTNEYIRGVKMKILKPFEQKLWQKSYYDHVIRNQQDYDEIWTYIENNPRKWAEDQ